MVPRYWKNVCQIYKNLPFLLHVSKENAKILQKVPKFFKAHKVKNYYKICKNHNTNQPALLLVDGLFVQDHEILVNYNSKK